MQLAAKTKRIYLLVILIIALLGVITTTVDIATSGRALDFARSLPNPNAPNILLVVIDTLRADHLSQYGYKRHTSVALDKLVSNSVLFKNAYSTSSWTVPATASIHTGLHPRHHQTQNDGDTLSTDFNTLAERLKQSGYETVGFSDNVHISEKTDFDQGFDYFFDFNSKSALAYPDMSRMMKKAKKWIDRHRNSKRPFFMYMQPMNCHGPYKVPKKHRKKLLNRYPSRKFRYYRSPMDKIMWHGKIKKRKAVTKRHITSLKEQYDTAIRYTTDQISAFLSFLNKSGFEENTMVIITADHGEELFDHGGFSHGYTLYNEVVKIPLIVKLPGQYRAKKESAMVSLMDIYPTITQVASDHKVATDGKSLLPYFDDVYSNAWIDTSNSVPKSRKRNLLLSLDWKRRGAADKLVTSKYNFIYIYDDYSGKDDVKELYRARDVHEKTNIASKKKKTLKRFQKQLSKQLSTTYKTSHNKAKNILKDMNVEALKSLGYIQ